MRPKERYFSVILDSRIRAPQMLDYHHSCMNMVECLDEKIRDLHKLRTNTATEPGPNKSLLNFKEDTLQRRRDYYQEVIGQQKFSHCIHKNEKFPVLDIQETYKDCLSSIHEEIEDEEDPLLRSNLLKKFQKLRQEMVDGNTE